MSQRVAYEILLPGIHMVIQTYVAASYPQRTLETHYPTSPTHPLQLLVQ